MKRLGLLAFLLLCLPAILLAQEKPAPAEAKKVIDYYYQGKDQGAVLVAHKLCAQIYEEGPFKYECQEVVTGEQIEKDREVFLWMSYLVPVGDKPDIIIHYKRNNKVRSVQNLELPGSIRYRTWKKIPTEKLGDWEVSILQELADTDLKLGEIKYSVVEADQ